MSVLPALADTVRFRDLVCARLGIYFDDTKLVNLATLLGARCGGDSGRYLDALATAAPNSEEIHALAGELTITETYFYRAGDQIRAFASLALPACLVQQQGSAPVRILSAGCASGEEPYTLAMAVRDAAPLAAHRIAITAFDANPVALAKAKKARYGRWAMRELPETARERWFAPAGEAFDLDPAIRDMVSFTRRNLVQDDPTFWMPASFDIVFCRNVLMYFPAAQAQAVVARIANALVPGGYLFLGHAETLRGLSGDFHLCHTHDTFYYQRKQVLGAQEDAPPPVPVPWRTLPAADDTSWIDTIGNAARRIDALAAGTQGHVARPAAASAPDLQQALASLLNEQFARGLDQIGALPAQHADDPDVLLLKAVCLSQSGAVAEADTVCRQLLGIDDCNAGAHYVQALCREQGGDVSGARTHYQSAAYLDPRFAMARLRLGLLARRQGERASARDELALALPLLQHEEAARLLLFGGGFSRETLIGLCRAELAALGRTHEH